MNSSNIIQSDYFDDEPFSRREALQFLIHQSSISKKQGEITTSFRYLGIKWKWSKSKVERFIAFLKDETIIETTINSGKTLITICNNNEATKNESIISTNCGTDSETIPGQLTRKQRLKSTKLKPQDNLKDETKTGGNQLNQAMTSDAHINAGTDFEAASGQFTGNQSIQSTKLKTRDDLKDTIKTGEDQLNKALASDTHINSGTDFRTIAGQSITTEPAFGQFQDNNDARTKTGSATANKALTADHSLAIETISGQNWDANFLKKEKNQKKEKNIKEKNIPFGDIKKEKKLADKNSGLESEEGSRKNAISTVVSANSSQGTITISPVSFESVNLQEFQAFAANLGISQNQLAWEFEKFKDYWLATRNKPPKDPAAAFRNWVRKSLEFKGAYHAKNNQNSNQTNEPTNFERFLAAGARVVAKHEGRGLDNETTW